MIKLGGFEEIADFYHLQDLSKIYSIQNKYFFLPDEIIRFVFVQDKINSEILTKL